MAITVRKRRENIESHLCHSVGVARGVSLEPIGRVDDAHLFFASRILTGMFLHILEQCCPNVEGNSNLHLVSD